VPAGSAVPVVVAAALLAAGVPVQAAARQATASAAQPRRRGVTERTERLYLLLVTAI
jgi:hypothetical protein